LFWLPVSGIVPIPSGPIADRYLYLPLIGLSMAAAALFQRHRSPWLVRGGGAILVLLAILSLSQSLIWRTDETLFSRVVALFPDQAYGYHNLGCYYLDRAKDLDRAERMFDEALRRDPLFPRLQTQKGYVRFMRGDLPGALAHYEEALRQNPFDGEALVKSGEVFELRGELSQALMRYQRFLSLAVSEIPWARPVIEERVRSLMQRNGGGRQ